MKNPPIKNTLFILQQGDNDMYKGFLNKTKDKERGVKMKMKKSIGLVAAVGIAAVLSGSPAEASPVLGPGTNNIYFNNAENWIDKDSSGAISVGDQFYGILHVQNIDNPGTIWNEDNVAAGGIDTLTGYFLTDVVATGFHGLNTHITFGAASSDPNGVMTSGDLASGVVLKLFADSTATPYTDDFSVATDIASATDGAFWASFTTAGGYWYAHAPLSVPASGDIGSSYFGLNLVVNNSGFTFLTIDDTLETESGSPLVNMYGESTISVNDLTATGSHWDFTSEDPSVVVTPEPGTFLLLGGGLLGLGMYARRRRAKK